MQGLITSLAIDNSPRAVGFQRYPCSITALKVSSPLRSFDHHPSGVDRALPVRCSRLQVGTSPVLTQDLTRELAVTTLHFGSCFHLRRSHLVGISACGIFPVICIQVGPPVVHAIILHQLPCASTTDPWRRELGFWNERYWVSLAHAISNARAYSTSDHIRYTHLSCVVESM